MDQTGNDERYYRTLHFSSSLSDHDHDSRPHECGMAITVPLILSLRVFKWFGGSLVCFGNFVVWWTSYSFYFVLLVFKGGNCTRVILLWKKSPTDNPLILTCVQTLMYRFQSNLSWWWAHLCFKSLIPLRVTLAAIQGYSCMRNQGLLCSLSGIFFSQFRWIFAQFHDLLVCQSSYRSDFAWSIFKWERALRGWFYKLYFYWFWFRRLWISLSNLPWW